MAGALIPPDVPFLYCPPSSVSLSLLVHIPTARRSLIHTTFLLLALYRIQSTRLFFHWLVPIPDNPPIMNRKFDRFRQWAGERMGGEIKTNLSDNFKVMETEMNVRHEGAFHN